MNRGARMMLGLDLSTLTSDDVMISLIATAAGLIVMFGMLGSNKLPALTAIFLLFMILISGTGFGFPFDELLPSHMIGIPSLLLLVPALHCMDRSLAAPHAGFT